MQPPVEFDDGTATDERPSSAFASSLAPSRPRSTGAADAPSSARPRVLSVRAAAAVPAGPPSKARPRVLSSSEVADASTGHLSAAEAAAAASGRHRDAARFVSAAAMLTLAEPGTEPAGVEPGGAPSTERGAAPDAAAPDAAAPGLGGGVLGGVGGRLSVGEGGGSVRGMGAGGHAAGGLAAALRPSRLAASTFVGSDDPLASCRALFDAEHCHSAEQLLLLRKASEVLLDANQQRVTSAVVEQLRAAHVPTEHRLLEGPPEAENEAENEDDDDDDDDEEEEDEDEEDEESGEEGEVGEEERRIITTTAATTTTARAFAPSGWHVRWRSKAALDAASGASDAMSEGHCDVLWGWKPNAMGAVMSRLLYTSSGVGDAVGRASKPDTSDAFSGREIVDSNAAALSSYVSVLTRYRRERRAAEEQQAAAVCQRHARIMLAANRRRCEHRETMRKYAAMRMLVRLQARFRSRRLRKAERARQEELSTILSRRRSSTLIQRAWKEELLRRVLDSRTVADILVKSASFLQGWRAQCSAELAASTSDAQARAHARWANVKSLNMTAALTVCSMLRQRVRAADCIRGANKAMLGQRHRAYFLAVLSLQRTLRKGVKAYNGRKAEREAQRNYDWIEQTESVLIIQRVYR